MPKVPRFVTFGMFIIDEFSFTDENGIPTGKIVPPQGSRGGGTYAAIGARIWLPPNDVGMIIDRGNDFPQDIQDKLISYGADMWHFRDHDNRGTTRALNAYRGDHRGLTRFSSYLSTARLIVIFQYLTPRIRLTPRDLRETRLTWPAVIHFICSPVRALQVISEIEQVDGWKPITIYEPIPYRCIPEELPSLIKALPSITVLSPNAEEAFSLLSISSPISQKSVEAAAAHFLELGVDNTGPECVIIRSGALGAYVATKTDGGQWVDAFWTLEDNEKVIDVTGAGNSFLGGLAAGLLLGGGDIYEGRWASSRATLYAAVSASFVIEQGGLPTLRMTPEGVEVWNNDVPMRRVGALRQRCVRKIHYKHH
ncbi:Ribokinase-like protein [Scleroderma citrinum]